MDDKTDGVYQLFLGMNELRCECTEEVVTWNLALIIGQNTAKMNKHFEQKQKKKKKAGRNNQPTNQPNKPGADHSITSNRLRFPSLLVSPPNPTSSIVLFKPPLPPPPPPLPLPPPIILSIPIAILSPLT